jgi:AsmA protein
MFGAEGYGHMWLDVSNKDHEIRVKYAINNFKIETFLSRFNQDSLMSGSVHLNLDIQLNDDISQLNGSAILEGKDLIVHNFDIDEVLTRFKRTQSFNLVDLGAFMLAGPAGAVVTKASDYAILLNADPTKKSTIRELISSWKFINGQIIADDVAFTTRQSRIALNGGIDFITQEFIELTVGVVDKKGCPLLSQTVRGSLSDPQFDQINAVSTILAPVTNVLKLITGSDCDPFYTGSLVHPTD